MPTVDRISRFFSSFRGLAKLCWLFPLVALSAESALLAQALDCPGSALRFRRWECTLPLVHDDLQGRGAYETEIQMTFTKPGSPSFVTFGFWDGGAGLSKSPAVYRFRALFPSFGTWTWTTTCLSGPCQGLDGWSLTVDVPMAIWLSDSLSRKGLLASVEYEWLAQDQTLRRWSTLVTGKEINPSAAENFIWVGDTAWAAPMRASLSEWTHYLEDRRSKRFTVVHLGPATHWAFHPHPAPAPKDVPFLEIPASQIDPPPAQGACDAGQPRPTPCSVPNPDYWRMHDQFVQEANQRGLYVFHTGLMEPDGSGSRYPSEREAKLFSRYRASRLAGNFVIFSPGFDSSTPLSLIEAAGAEIKRVVPRHLVTNHWNANVSPSQMAALQGRPWLDFQMAQSGFGGSQSSPPPLQVLAQRARELPQVMSGATGDSTYTANRKAIVNGEGVYDHGRAVSQSQFNRFRARQSGYWSFLSGSIGYTFGAAGIWEWGLCGEPNESLRWSACDQYFGGRSEVNYRTYSQAMSQASSIDMQHFSYLHKTIWDHSAADYLDVFEHWRIANQPQNDQHRKMVVARSSDWFFAYLPENEEIHVNVWGLTGDPAARLWFDPREGVYRSEGNWSCSENFQ